MILIYTLISILIALLILYLLLNISYNTGDKVIIIERFGRFNRVANVGFYFVFPLVESIAGKFCTTDTIEYCRNNLEIKVCFSLKDVVTVYYQFGSPTIFVHSLVNQVLDQSENQTNLERRVYEIEKVLNESLENSGISIDSVTLDKINTGE